MSEKAKRLKTDEMHSIQAMLKEILSSPQAIQKFHDILNIRGDEEALQWHKFYEYPPERAIRTIWVAFGFKDLHAAKLKNGENPFSVILEKTFFSRREWNKHRLPIASPILLVSAFLSQSYDIECVSKHGLHMYDMLQRGKKGHDQSFLNAIKIDAAIINTHAVQVRFNRSLKRKDDNFKYELMKAVEGNDGQHKLNRQHMRTFLHIFIETGQITEFSNEDLHAKFIELGINEVTADNRDNIRTLKANTKKAMKNSDYAV